MHEIMFHVLMNKMPMPLVLPPIHPKSFNISFKKKFFFIVPSSFNDLLLIKWLGVSQGYE